MNGTFLTGGTLVMMPRFDADQAVSDAAKTLGQRHRTRHPFTHYAP
jgi:hypothetical protein